MPAHCQATVHWDSERRLAALRAYDIVDSGPEPTFDEITQIAREVCQTPMAVVTFLEAERQWFKSEIGLGFRETTLDRSICAQTIHLSELVIINDLAADARLCRNPFVEGQPNLRFYAGARLECPDGYPLGAICVLDIEPRPAGLTPEQSRLLLVLARAAMRELELRRASREKAANLGVLEATLAHVDQGILMVDDKGRVVVCNQRAIDLLGLPPEMMRSSPRFDDVKKWQAAQGEFAAADPWLLRAISDEGIDIQASVYERQRPNGTVLEVRTNCLPSGGVVRTFADITERKRAQEAAATSEARYRSLCDALPQKVLVTNAAGEITYQNRQFSGYFGDVGPSLEGRARLNHPEDAAAILRARSQAVASGRSVQGEARLQAQDGSYRWHHLTLNPIRRDADITEWVATSLDIDELRRTQLELSQGEERYRALVEASSVVVWTASPSGKITQVWGQGTKRVSTAENSGFGWLGDIHPDDIDGVITDWRGRLTTPETFTNEYRARGLDGEYRWFLSRGVPLTDKFGAVREWVGAIADIHDRKSAEERLRESEERYRLVAHATSDAVWDWDLGSNALQWGGGLHGVVGYAPDATPRSGTAWLECIHPDDRPMIETQMQAFKSGRIGERWEGEYRWTKVDGSHAFVRDRCYLVRDQTGTPVRMVGALQDLTESRKARAAVQTSEERLRLALAATGLGIWDIDFIEGHREWSPEVRQIFGLPHTIPAGKEHFLPHVHPEDRTWVAKEFYPAFDEGAPSVSASFRIIRADDGQVRWVEVGGKTLYDASGRGVRMLGTIQDITQRKLADDALLSGGERLRLALHASKMVAWDLDLATGWVNRSDNSVELLGFGSGPTSIFVERVHPEDRHKVSMLRIAAIADGTHTAEVRYHAPGDREIWLALRAERKDAHRLIGITFDISDAKAAEQAIWQTANRDPLTGLANRALFKTCLDQALGQAEGDGSCVGLLLLDLDDFKDINDTLGHAAGDTLLAETAARLTRLVNADDTVARVGGDEFAILLAGRSSLEDIALQADTMVQALRAPFDFEGRALSTRASIGVAVSPRHHRDPVELMKDADIALYRAKASGRGQAVVYTEEARAVMERRVSILREVRKGIESNEFKAHYQPKVSLATGQIAGFEALARWDHPDKGLLTPAYFRSALDDHDIATALATCMVRQVAQDVRAWLDQGFACGRVAVNFSPADFVDRSLASRVIDILDDARVPLSHFEIEVTETVFLGRVTEDASSILSEFHEAGVSIALDDFGTGFASLTHLKQFPVDHIKIDQSFIRNLETDSDDAAIVAAVVSLGRNMGKFVTAEGVENAAQVKRLREAGCDFAQGYLYAKPMRGLDVAPLFRTWSPPEEVGLRHLPNRLIRR